MSDPYIYTQLNTKKLSTVTAEEIMNITDPTHIEFENQYDLERYNLINKALMRDGNVMPNTGGIESYTQSDANVAVNIIPPNGEVWKIMGIGITNSLAPTGTNAYYTFLSDPTQTALNVTPAASRDVFYSSFSSASTTLATETVFEEVFQPLLITSQMYLRMYSNMSAVQAGATVAYKVAFMRIR